MNLPPNLAALGYKRLVGPPEPDVRTLWLIRSPLVLIAQLMHPWYFGTVTSGYREEPGSTHGWGMAMDYGFDRSERVLWCAHEFAHLMGTEDSTGGLVSLVTRLGLYPHRKFIHIDISPPELIEYLNKARWWHENKDGEIIVHKTLDEAIKAAEEEL